MMLGSLERPRAGRPAIGQAQSLAETIRSIQVLPRTTLGDLPGSQLCIDLETPGNVLLHAFEEDFELPGVLVREGDRCAGVISRQRFLLYMSCPYSQELYLKRPVKRFLGMYAADKLELPARFPIDLAVRNALARPKDLLGEPIVVCGVDGSCKLVDLHLLLVAQSELLRRLSDLQQQTERSLRQLNQDLETQATLDCLTGIANRRKFDSDLQQAWHAHRRDGKYLALILGDVDDFKHYNDTYGHPAGDECLRRIAHALSKTLHNSANSIARYGGEEFAILLANTPSDDAREVAELLREAVEQLFLPNEGSSLGDRVTLSLGVCAAVPSSQTSPELLLRSADTALYDAKRLGRNRVVARSLLSPEDRPINPVDDTPIMLDFPPQPSDAVGCRS